MFTETQGLHDARRRLRLCAQWLYDAAELAELSQRQLLRACPSLEGMTGELTRLVHALEEDGIAAEQAARALLHIQDIYEESEEEIIGRIQ